MASEAAVQVYTRFRPLNEREKKLTAADAAFLDEGDELSSLGERVFPRDTPQEKVYDAVARATVDDVLSGFNGTIFAYGQTGAGKTFTMEGVQDPPELRGIIPNAFQQIFDRVALAAEGVQFLVRASYLEIYNEEVRDLLAKDPKNRLDLKENVDSGVYVRDRADTKS